MGEFAKSLQINTLLSVGVLSQSASDSFAKNNVNGDQSQHFTQKNDLMDHLISIIKQQLLLGQKEISILVKGSRSAHMEHVVIAVVEWLEQKNTRQKKAAQQNIIQKHTSQTHTSQTNDEDGFDNNNKNENQTSTQTKEGMA